MTHLLLDFVSLDCFVDFNDYPCNDNFSVYYRLVS